MNEEQQEHYLQVLWEKMDTLIDRMGRIVTLLEDRTTPLFVLNGAGKIEEKLK